MKEITFTSCGAPRAVWHLAATGDEFAGRGGQPCVVIATTFRSAALVVSPRAAPGSSGTGSGTSS
jgi:hypothetical protein